MSVKRFQSVCRVIKPVNTACYKERVSFSVQQFHSILASCLRGLRARLMYVVGVECRDCAGAGDAGVVMVVVGARVGPRASASPTNN